MTKKVKIIVIDANILLRAVLGIRTFSLIAEHRENILFVPHKFVIVKLLFIFLILLENVKSNLLKSKKL